MCFLVRAKRVSERTEASRYQDLVQDQIKNDTERQEFRQLEQKLIFCKELLKLATAYLKSKKGNLRLST